MSLIDNKQENVAMKPITKGLLSDEYFDYNVVPDDSLSYIENGHNDVIGTVTGRGVFSKLGLPYGGSNAINAMYGFSTATGSNTIIYNDNGVLKYITGPFTGSSVTIGSLINNLVTPNFDSLQGKVIIASSGLPLKYWNPTGNVYANMTTSFTNQTDLISVGVNGRVWGAISNNVSPRLYYSNVIPNTGVENTTGGTEWIELNTDNGDRITAIKRMNNVNYVFTNNGLFRVSNPTNFDSNSISQAGTPSYKSVTMAKDGMYFINPIGIFKVVDGGTQEISQVIRPIFNKINTFGLLASIAWSDEHNVYFSVGSDIVGYDNTKNWIIKFNIDTKTFSIYSNKGYTITSAIGYTPQFDTITSIDQYPTVAVAGQGGGTPYISLYNMLATDKKNLANGDNTALDLGNTGDPIPFKYITQWQTLGPEYFLKEISGISIQGTRCAGLTLSYQVDDEIVKWNSIAKLKDTNLHTFKTFTSKPFGRIRFMVHGDYKGQALQVGQPILHKINYVATR